MKLITNEIEKRFQEIGDQSKEADPIVVTKYFNPTGGGTWYATEYDAEYRIAYGYVTGLAFDEWGTFSISELASLKCPPFGMPIERDLYCGEKRISEHCPELKEQIEKLKKIQKERKKRQQQNTINYEQER